MLILLVLALACGAASATAIGSVGPECAACGFVYNAVEGFIAEPRSEAEIAQFIRNNVCQKLSLKYKLLCDLISVVLPRMIVKYDAKHPISAACTRLGMCHQNLTQAPDMGALPSVIVSLDEPPQTRWSAVCALPKVGEFWNSFIDVIRDVLPNNGTRINELGEAALLLLPTEFAAELTGCAAAANVQKGWMTWVNLAYELTATCTSIVAQTADGTPIHARNLDFGMGGFLTETMRQVAALVQFTSGGKVVSQQTSFLGFIGALTGQQLGQFSVTINTRFYQGNAKQSLLEYLEEYIWALKQYPKAQPASYVSRYALQYGTSFSDAVSILTNTELIADVYYTVSGISGGQGIVISRNRTGASNLWPLFSSKSGPGSWYVLITNYDHTKSVPWFDDRRDAGYALMDAMGQKRLSLAGLLNVVSTRPVLNLQTAISMLAVNRNSSYSSWTRACAFPCPE